MSTTTEISSTFRTFSIAASALLFPFLTFLASPGLGQQEVTDLTGKDYTAEEVVKALNTGMRGLDADCSGYQKKMAELTRGIGFTPTTKEDVPALETLKSVNLTVNFELDSDELTTSAKSGLETVAAALRSQDLAAQCFQLAGHTCDLGADAYNLDLSRRRAAAVKQFLVSKGVDGDRIVTTGFGETAPQVPNTSESNRQKNRRVELGTLAPTGSEGG